ncbi:MAG: sarcosine oxidase subunit beta family protein [Hyphomonadaceae bacterium]|nr:sarcosine oxidase subunit beta family protein [Hyphomonadaceae bacterium]
MPRPGPRGYSFATLARQAATGHAGWRPAWRTPALREAYDFVIVGGGGHGLATAYYLARHHGARSVAVLEKGWIGGGNTGRNTTIVRSNYKLEINQRFYDYSLGLWETLTRELNFNVMFSPRGVLFLAHSDSDMNALAERGDAMRLRGIDAELLSLGDVRRFAPILDCSPQARFPIHGGLLQRRAGTARHDAVAWGYARAADALGVDIIQNCAVTGFDIAGGRTIAVRTTQGRVAAGRIGVVVAGASSTVMAMAGLRLPIETHLLQAFVSEPVKPMVHSVLLSGAVHCYLSQTDKGEIVLGGDLDFYPSVSQRGGLHRIEQVAAQAIAMVPALGRLRMQRAWAGAMDMTMDGAPIIGATPIEGLYLNGGWCYGGFKATPASGYTFAHTLATGAPHPLNAPYSLDRFARGATIDEAGAGPTPHLH